MKRFSIGILMFALSGCVVGTGGSGQLTDGTPIIAKSTTSGGLMDGFTYTLSTLDGLNCTGYVPINTGLVPKVSDEMALDCGKGLTGRAVVTYGQNTNIVFKLSDGRQGSAKIEEYHSPYDFY